jgi:hypothetical protein
MSSQVIGPPPRSILPDRELYLWLTRVYAVLNGQDSSYELSGDTISNTSTSNAHGAELAKSVQGAELMQLRAQVGEMQKQLDQMALMIAQRQTVIPDTIPAPVLSIGEINKRIEEAILWQPHRNG